MENPATWGRAEHIISEVVTKHRRNMARPPTEMRIGASLPKMITTALRDEFLLKSEHANVNIQRLLEQFKKLHEHVELDKGDDDDDGYIRFKCAYCSVPAPCPSQQIVDDLEEYVF